MLRYLPLLLLLFTSCESDDNYDLTQEIEGPREPVVVDDSRPYAIFTTGDSTEIEYGGSASSTASGFTLLTTTDYVKIQCSSTLKYQASGVGPPTLIFFTIKEDGSVEDILVQASRFYSGDIENGFGRNVRPCESVPTIFEITTLTEDSIAGFMTAEFFYTDKDLPILGDCSNLVSMGVRTIEFAVPLEKC